MNFANRYAHRLQTKPGLYIYQPTPEFHAYGKEVASQIDSKWKRPTHYYHLNGLGHLKLVKKHLNDSYFAKVDILSFFEQVSRNRIFKTLRKLSFTQKVASEISELSTVIKDGKKVLPYGFCQSPIIASAVLDLSLLGFYLQNTSTDINISIYMDDILLSSNNKNALDNELAQIKETAKKSNWELNSQKSSCRAEPALQIFNLNISYDMMELNHLKFNEYVSILRKADTDNDRRNGILRYVHEVNDSQYDLLLEKTINTYSN